MFPLNKEDLDSILLFVFCVSSLKYGKVVCGDELDRNYSKIDFALFWLVRAPPGLQSQSSPSVRIKWSEVDQNILKD